MPIDSSLVASASAPFPPDSKSCPEFFADKSRFVRQAMAEHLRIRHLPPITFLELSSADQSKVLARAEEFERRSRRIATSSGHEGAIEAGQ